MFNFGLNISIQGEPIISLEFITIQDQQQNTNI